MILGLKQLSSQYTTKEIQQTKQFYTGRGKAAQGHTRLDLTTPDGLTEAREASEKRVIQPSREVIEQRIKCNGRSVLVRIIHPKQGKPKGVHLDFPGGGFYLSMAARNDILNEKLADALRVVVVCVDYRLAPENPWPAAPDDCETAALWLIEQAETVFGTKQLTMGGFSAGSNLAMTTMLRLQDRGAIGTFKGAVLQFGAYDYSGQTPGGRLYADEYFIRAYAGNTADRTQPGISPIFGDLKGLPPSLIVVGAKDPVLEDSLAMTARLIAAGCEADLRIYPESPHGFTLHQTPIAAAAITDITNWLKPKFAD